MAHLTTILGQMLQLVPRHVFDHIVDTHKHQGPKVRKFSYWSQFVAMLYAQYACRKSLRDLEFSLNRHANKLYHLGITDVKRSTLAEANEHRPAIVFEKLYHKLYEQMIKEEHRQKRKDSNIKIMDATTIELCASVFPWAKYRTRKGAVKLHTVLSLSDMMPQCIILTEGKVHEINVARSMKFHSGDLLIMDRGYIDYSWLYGLNNQGVWFVTRLKSNACFEVIENKEIDPTSNVLADEIIKLTSDKAQEDYPELLRRVHFLDPETGHHYVFLTNRFDLSAATIAELYRQRWQIELFFKWIKQNLKIKTFYGTSKNAVLIQLWTAIIAYLMLYWLKLRSKVGWSLLELIRMVQTMLMDHRSLWDMLCPKKKRPPQKDFQKTLFNFCAGH
jgi:putative transposase